MANKVLLCLLFIGVANALSPLTIAGVKMIFPKKVLDKIPEILIEKMKDLDEDDDSLTTSYTFPKEYKKTLYKDFAQKTTLVNVYPTVETQTNTLEFFNPGYQTLETSTTLIYEMANSTVEYQTIPMLNSTLEYPTTAPVQIFRYATHEYQHEILVYPTKINITQLSSTVVGNFTRVEHVQNSLPFL